MPKQKSATSARTAHSPDQPLIALAWMTLSAFGFSIMALAVKKISSHMPQFELVFFRAFLNFLPVWFILRAKRIPLIPPGSDRWVLVLRGLAGFGSLSCWFYTLEHVPLTIAMMLLWCSPLFVIFLSRVFLGEKLIPLHWGCVLLSFVGLSLLLRPNLAGATEMSALSPWGVFLGLLSAALAGSAYVAIRSIATRINPHLIVFYFVAIASLLSFPFAVAKFKIPNGSDLFWLFIIGLTSTVAQFSMTRSYQYAPAGQVSTMGLLNAAFAAVWGWLFFGDTLVFWQWTGMTLLAIGVALLSLARSSRTPDSHSV